MTPLTDYTGYADAHRHLSSAALWSLFDGGRESLNIAVECLDRHADSGRVAVRVAHADGRDEILGFHELSEWSARFAHWLAARGVRPGDRVAIEALDRDVERLPVAVEQRPQRRGREVPMGVGVAGVVREWRHGSQAPLYKDRA